jgi:hypothetical protein
MDRRKNPRFQPAVSAVVECHDAKHGLMVDISLDGLAFKYYDFGFERKRNVTYPLQVTLSLANDFIVQNVPCKIVNDLSILQDFEEDSIELRQCSLQFEKLAANQKKHLEYFIKNFTS